MEDVKQQIKELLEHNYKEDALVPVLQQLKDQARATALAAFGGWADMDDDLYNGLISGEYRRTPDENRQLHIDEAVDWSTDDIA